jgi:hypothetical protein
MLPALPAFLQNPPPRQIDVQDPWLKRSLRNYRMQPVIALGFAVFAWFAFAALNLFDRHEALSEALIDATWVAFGFVALGVLPMWLYARSNMGPLLSFAREGTLIEATVIRAHSQSTTPYVAVSFQTADGGKWVANFPIPDRRGRNHHLGEKLHVLTTSRADRLVALVAREGMFVDRAREA